MISPKIHFYHLVASHSEDSELSKSHLIQVLKTNSDSKDISTLELQ